MDKREFLKSVALLGVGTIVTPSFANVWSDDKRTIFELPKLDYAFNALEPYIDAQTMEIHYGKHHAGYVNNLNKAIENSRFSDKDIQWILQETKPEEAAIRNNGGGHFNHTLFWKLLTQKSSKKPTGKLAKAITEAFGSFEAFQKQFDNVAKSRFGSGWAWLSVNSKNELFVSSTPNQDNPLMKNIVKPEEQGFPVLALDVWEHAYYLQYQNRRPDYVSAFWSVVNWEYANERYLLAGQSR